MKYEIKTCVKCGTVRKTERAPETPCYSYEECPHEVTDNRGSTRTTHKIWCKQCQNYILEEPQELYQDRIRKAKEIVSGGRKTMPGSA